MDLMPKYVGKALLSKANGKMAQSEWIYDLLINPGTTWNQDGSYARNTWQGNYYLKSDGKMAKNERVGWW